MERLGSKGCIALMEGGGELENVGDDKKDFLGDGSMM